MHTPFTAALVPVAETCKLGRTALRALPRLRWGRVVRDQATGPFSQVSPRSSCGRDSPVAN